MRRWLAIFVTAAIIAGVVVIAIVASRPAQNASASSATGASPTGATASPSIAPGGAASATTTSAAARAAAAAPPAVKLHKLPQTFKRPVYLTAAPGDTTRLFVVEKGGTIRIVKDGAKLSAPFLDIRAKVSTGTEQGLLSMAFAPDYATSGFFYVDYTNTSGTTRVVRYKVSGNPDVADAGSAHVVLSVHQPYANHNGGQLQFGPDGRLYVGLGDGGSEGDPNHYGQNRSTLLAKILRLNVNVSPVRVQKYAMGLRNPWRFSFDSKTGALWIGDVGQDRWEEIDYLRPGAPAGANFGWSAYEGTHVYNSAIAARVHKSSLTWPVAQYSHSVGDVVTGGYVYRGSAIPGLRGWYLFADFATARLWAKHGPGGGMRRLPGADGKVAQISSFGQDADGELYLVSLAGSISKIVP